MGRRGPQSKYANKAEKLQARRLRYQERKIAQNMVDGPHVEEFDSTNNFDLPVSTVEVNIDTSDIDCPPRSAIQPVPSSANSMSPILNECPRSQSPLIVPRPTHTPEPLSLASNKPLSPDAAAFICSPNSPASDSAYNSDTDYSTEINTPAMYPLGNNNQISLSTQLVQQLIQFQGCCQDCHTQIRVKQDQVRKSELSLSLSEIIQWPCPDVVGTARMARSDDSWISEWSATQQEKLFCGISPSDSKEPPHVMLDLSQEHLNQSDITFDIDSVSAYLSSLAAARCGIRWYPSQPPVSSLRSSLHLDPIPVQYVDHDGKHHSVNVPLHQVNHIALGRVVGLEDASIYVFFPGLYRPNQRTNRLRDYEFQIWMDEIVLPAIHQCYSGSELQHYPSSFRHGQANSWAAWAEGRSIHTQSRQQLLSYFVPAEQLNRLWEKMLQIIKERHLTGFDHLLLFLDAKNLKLSTKARTWAAMRTWF